MKFDNFWFKHTFWCFGTPRDVHCPSTSAWRILRQVTLISSAPLTTDVRAARAAALPRRRRQQMPARRVLTEIYPTTRALQMRTGPRSMRLGSNSHVFHTIPCSVGASKPGSQLRTAITAWQFLSAVESQMRSSSPAVDRLLDGCSNMHAINAMVVSSRQLGPLPVPLRVRMVVCYALVPQDVAFEFRHSTSPGRL